MNNTKDSLYTLCPIYQLLTFYSACFILLSLPVKFIYFFSEPFDSKLDTSCSLPLKTVFPENRGVLAHDHSYLLQEI